MADITVVAKNKNKFIYREQAAAGCGCGGTIITVPNDTLGWRAKKRGGPWLPFKIEFKDGVSPFSAWNVQKFPASASFQPRTKMDQAQDGEIYDYTFTLLKPNGSDDWSDDPDIQIDDGLLPGLAKNGRSGGLLRLGIGIAVAGLALLALFSARNGERPGFTPSSEL
jgi:hypothetical protein